MVKPFENDIEKVNVGKWKSDYNRNRTWPKHPASAQEFANARQEKSNLIELALSKVTSDPKQDQPPEESSNFAISD